MTWVYEAPPSKLSADQIEILHERLTMEHVAERYGFNVERGKIICPFHEDTRPSCYVYPGDRGFYCFACGAGGDAVSFVGRLLGLDYCEAAAQLDADFGLGLGNAPRNDALLAKLQAQRAAKAQEAEKRAEEARLFSERVKALRVLPAPHNCEEAARYGMLRGELEYMEYLIEEFICPEE